MEEPFKQPKKDAKFYKPKGSIQAYDGVKGITAELKAVNSNDPEPTEAAMSLTAVPSLVVGLSSRSGPNLAINNIVAINAVKTSLGEYRLLVETNGTSVIAAGTANLTGAGGVGDSPTIATVTAGERWRIKFVSKGGSSGNTYIFVTDDNINTGDQIYFTGTSTAASSNGWDFILESGTKLFMLATGNGGDAARTWGLIYERI